MHFTKMQGAGNDYIYVDCFREAMPAQPDELAKKISDRHFGVGSDGLILICPSDQADAQMRMFNADGSESEMCGNGVRCVAKYVYDHGICRNETLRIETGRGVLTLKLEVAAGRVERVESIWASRSWSRRRYPSSFRSVTTGIASSISRWASTFHFEVPSRGWQIAAGTRG